MILQAASQMACMLLKKPLLTENKRAGDAPIYIILPLVSFMQVVRKAGSEVKLKAVFHS